MPLTLGLINVVLVGESFPTQSIRASDFTFRGRELQEKLRVGPAMQATSRNVTVTVLPDRFECAVEAPDDVSIQVQGMIEVVRVFQGLVGSRAVRQVGHNANFTVDLATYSALFQALVRLDVADAVVGSEVGRQGALNLKFESPGVSNVQVALSPTEDAKGGLAINFHHELDPLDLSVEDTLERLEANIGRAAELAGRISALTQDTGVKA